MSKAEELITTSISIKGIFDKMYCTLSRQCESAFYPMQRTWGNDLVCHLRYGWGSVIRSTTHVLLRILKETNYKFIFEFYLTPVKLNHMFPYSSPNCPKCRTEKQTFLHQFWHCNRLRFQVLYSYRHSEFLGGRIGTIPKPLPP